MKRLALCLAALLLTACETPFQRSGRLEKENQELRGQLAKQQQERGLDSQAKCAAAAKAYFNDNELSLRKATASTAFITYENHYNSSLNRCFILIHHGYYMRSGKNMWHSEVLTDVFENKDRAYLYTTEDKEPETIGCSVDDVTCMKTTDFDRLVKPFMTN
jgi:hypothetical protein